MSDIDRLVAERATTQHALITADQFAGSDHPRQNDVVLSGWTLLRYTRRMYLRQPERIVREVRRALAGSEGTPAEPAGSGEGTCGGSGAVATGSAASPEGTRSHRVPVDSSTP